MTAGAEIETGAPWTLLEEALYWGHQALAGDLIERYPAKFSLCAPPLHPAVYLDSEDLVRCLLDRGARQDIVDPRFNATPIEWSRHFGPHELPDLLEA